MEDKIYIGDAVYVERTFSGVVLTTENGIEKTNTILLEPEVLEDFENIIRRWREEPKDGNGRKS